MRFTTLDDAASLNFKSFQTVADARRALAWQQINEVGVDPADVSSLRPEASKPRGKIRHSDVRPVLNARAAGR